MRHSWFESISARRGLGKSASRLTSLGEIEAIAMGPVACINTFYCGRTAKSITLTTAW